MKISVFLTHINAAIFTVILATGVVSARVPGDDLDADFDALDAKLELAFLDQDAELEKQFVRVQQAVDKAYKGLTDKISVDWGSDVKLPDAKHWTTYSSDFSTRAEFDFENGVYRVEALVTEDVAKSLLMLKAMAARIATSEPGSLRQQDVFLTEVNKQLEQSTPGATLASFAMPDKQSHIDVDLLLPLDTQVLIDNINIQQLQPPKSKAQIDSLSNLSTDKIEAATAIQQPSQVPAHDVSARISQPSDVALVKTEQGASSNVESEGDELEGEIESSLVVQDTESATLALQQSESIKKLVLTIPFINEYQKQLMETRLDRVKMLAAEYKIDPSLIMAVIETESSFNPMATSPIPAFGLMQLVPRSGGVDAYHFIYGSKKVVSPDYLYDQDNNLLLGTAYLHLLANRYLSGIHDEVSRLYCVLASYNIGVGNLAKTFTREKGLSKAVKRANSMSSQELYDFLQAHLPAEETRNYLKKVLARKRNYAYLDS